jgi:hypothetical protein
MKKVLKIRAILILHAGLMLVFLSIGGVALAQDSEGDSPRIEIAFPIEFDIDYGATNGYAVINRYLPLIAFPMGEKWKLINLTLATVADAPGGIPGFPGNPEPVSGGRVFGLGDLTDVVFFTPPAMLGNLLLGFGPAVGFPIATDDRLGSGKWTIGPAVRITYRPGPWNLGAVVVNLWSFAGDSDRKDVNQLMVRGLIRRNFGSGWYFTSNPIITANWKASSGQQWLVPIGGGIGKLFELGSAHVALSIHAYYYAIKPDGAPNGLFRVALTLPIP